MSSVAPTVAPSMLGPAASVAAVPLLVHGTPTKQPAMQPTVAGNSASGAGGGGGGTPSRGIRLVASNGGPKPKMIKIVRHEHSTETFLRTGGEFSAEAMQNNFIFGDANAEEVGSSINWDGR